MNKPDCPPSPFVGLVPFREIDAPFFRGRETERDLIVENLRASRLTLLYGASGVGKSSVLYAGAAHRLRELARQDAQEYGKPDFAVVTFRTWGDDPIQGLLRSINEAMAEALQVKSLLDVPDSNNLAHIIGAWTERYGIELLIILDQFEEYFQYHPNEQGPGTFAEEFPRAVNDPELRAKFLLALRDDALSKLDRFKSQVPYLFDNLLRIRHMTVDAARKAIKEPIDEYNKRCGFEQAGSEYTIETELVEEVIKQVRAARDTTEGQDGVAGVEAPYLQLVMTRLWEKEREDGSRLLRSQTLEDLKGIKNIVQVYLNNALEQLKPEQKSIAFRVFDYLVTPSGTKIAYFKSDLISQTRFTETQIGGVLEALDKSRILRSVPSIDRPDESRYEVFHDLLALAIINWRTQYEAITKAEAQQATAAAELAEAERQRRLVAQARENRRLRLGLTLLVLLLLSAVGFGIYASSKRTQANRASQLASTREAQAMKAEAEARQLYLEASVEKKRADEAARVASIEEGRAMDALKAAKLAEERATTQSRIVMEQLGRIQALQAQLDALEERRAEELEKIEKQTTDPNTRLQIASYRETFKLDRTRKLTNQQERSVASEQQQESTSGRPVKEGDQIQRKLWQNGKTLHFKFIGGSRALQERIEQVAQEWTQTGANIKFVFDNSPDAEIRIKFDQNDGSWSFGGTDALAIPKAEPSMNLGFASNTNINGDDFRQTVLVNFGYMLGLINEHQNPNANIPWNKKAVYTSFMGPPNYWSRDVVDSQVFRTYRGDYREFDRRSIMMRMTIPKNFLLGDTFAPILELATVLSESDKKLIRDLYPRP
ncbi:MAG TPA: hypothetical protein VJU86_16940 [Pyrinomonadaceae bacterium]|nr:hypothetical protein [Pyrinomonadaceae bacterium]